MCKLSFLDEKNREHLLPNALRMTELETIFSHGLLSFVSSALSSFGEKRRSEKLFLQAKTFPAIRGSLLFATFRSNPFAKKRI